MIIKIEMLILYTWMLTHSGTIAINIYIYAQCVILIAGEKFVSFVELSVSLPLSRLWLLWIVQSDITSFFTFNDTEFLAADK